MKNKCKKKGLVKIKNGGRITAEVEQRERHITPANCFAAPPGGSGCVFARSVAPSGRSFPRKNYDTLGSPLLGSPNVS